MAIAVAGYVAGRGPAPQPAGMPSPVVAAGPPPEPIVNLPKLPAPRQAPAAAHTARLVPALLVVLAAL